MIKAEFYVLKDGRPAGFRISGHAGYAEEGEDIICAAVSAVAYTALGYMDELLVKEKGRHLDFTEKDGELFWKRYGSEGSIGDLESEKVEAVLEAMKVGLSQIEGSYGRRYLNVTSQEVRL